MPNATTDAEVDPILSIATSWRRYGHCRPLNTRVHSMCQVPGCFGLVFASVRTDDGIRSLCLRHFAAACELGKEVCYECPRRRWCVLSRNRPSWVPAPLEIEPEEVVAPAGSKSAG